MKTEFSYFITIVSKKKQKGKNRKKLLGFPNWEGKRDNSILKYQNETSALKNKCYLWNYQSNEVVI